MTGTVVGALLLETGVQVGCDVTAAVAVCAICSSEGAPAKLQALTTSAIKIVSAKKTYLLVAIQHLSAARKLQHIIA